MYICTCMVIYYRINKRLVVASVYPSCVPNLCLFLLTYIISRFPFAHALGVTPTRFRSKASHALGAKPHTPCCIRLSIRQLGQSRMSGDDRLLAAVETNDKEKLTSMLRKRQPHQAEVREALEHAVTQATPELARLLATHKSVYRSGDVLAGLLQLGIKHGSRWSRRQEAVVEVLKILIETGADLEYCDGHGRTSLHIAAQHAFPHAVDLLVKHGANPDARDCKQQTPLMVAVQSQGRVPAFVACDERETDRFNRLSTVVLLQPVSAVDGRDRSGKTAEEMANENGFREAAHILKKDVSAGTGNCNLFIYASVALEKFG